MARLNLAKIVGLVLLLGIALTLPTVLPDPDYSVNGQGNTRTTTLLSNA